MPTVNNGGPLFCGLAVGPCGSSGRAQEGQLAGATAPAAFVWGLAVPVEPRRGNWPWGP